MLQQLFYYVLFIALPLLDTIIHFYTRSRNVNYDLKVNYIPKRSKGLKSN